MDVSEMTLARLGNGRTSKKYHGLFPISTTNSECRFVAHHEVEVVPSVVVVEEPASEVVCQNPSNLWRQQFTDMEKGAAAPNNLMDHPPLY